MDKYIFDESNGLWYELQGDYYIPCLILSEKETQPIGLWGQRHKQYLKVQKQAKAIKKIQEITLPNLRQQLAETTGIFKGKERKALEKQIQQTESELKEKLDKLPDILKDDGYPDVQAFMKTYRKAEAIVTQYNQDLAEWEQTVKNGQKPAEKQHRPPERQSVRNRLRQLQEEGKQNSQPKQRKKSQDRDR